MRRWAPAVLSLLLAAIVILSVVMRWTSDDPAAWHVDPATAQRTGSSNDYLVAPAGRAAATPDSLAEVRPLPPRELLARFDAIATAAPRTARLAGWPDDGLVTYVQRSRLFGFPDYISVSAVEVAGGSALIIWSRSRFGFADFGVNRARIEEWLERLGGTPG